MTAEQMLTVARHDWRACNTLANDEAGMQRAGARCSICRKQAVRITTTGSIAQEGLNFVCWDHWYQVRQADGDFDEG
jgi:hypothetical protein